MSRVFLRSCGGLPESSLVKLRLDGSYQLRSSKHTDSPHRASRERPSAQKNKPVLTGPEVSSAPTTRHRDGSAGKAPFKGSFYDFVCNVHVSLFHSVICIWDVDGRETKACTMSWKLCRFMCTASVGMHRYRYIRAHLLALTDPELRCHAILLDIILMYVVMTYLMINDPSRAD